MMIHEKLFTSALIIVASVEAQDAQPTGPIGKPIWEAYNLLRSRPLYSAITSNGLLKNRQADICNFPLDIVLVQDSTASFRTNIADMLGTQIDEMTKILSENHPGSRIGLMAFRDKPVAPFGDAKDYCYAQTMSLRPLNSALIRNVYNMTPLGGGADPAENQLQAVMATLNDPLMGWDESGNSAKLVVLATDSWPHYADDGLNTMGLQTFTGEVDWSNFANQCLWEYYPSPEQFFEAIAGANSYMGTLIFNGYLPNITNQSWSWVNSYIGQPSLFVEPLANNPSDFWDKLLGMISAIEHNECRISTTTSSTVASSQTKSSPSTNPTTLSTTTAVTTTTTAATTATTTATMTATTTATTTAATTTTTTTPTTRSSTASPTTTTANTTVPALTTTRPTVAPTTKAVTTIVPTTTTCTTIPISTMSTTMVPIQTTTKMTSTFPTTPTNGSTTRSNSTIPLTTKAGAGTTGSNSESISSSEGSITGDESSTSRCCGNVCPCPDVIIALKQRPQQLHFDMKNTQ